MVAWVFSLFFLKICDDDRPALSVDNGSGVCKTQFAGENAPRAVLDSGHPGNQVWMSTFRKKWLKHNALYMLQL